MLSPSSRGYAMLQSPALALRSKVATCISMVPGIADARPNVVQPFDRLHDEEATRSSLLDRYRKGWSEANPDKILDVTAPGYRFRDPSLEAFRGGRCTSISISCRTDSPAQGQSRGGISAFS